MIHERRIQPPGPGRAGRAPTGLPDGAYNCPFMEPIRALFSKHGLRCTPQREEVYRALASTKAHPTAEELLGMVRPKQPGISLATVYNTLDAFERRGLCRKFNVTTEAGGSSAARFDADVSEHVHLLTDDGRVRDIPPDMGDQLLASLPAELIEAIERRLGVRIDGVRVEFVGRPVDGGRC